MNTHRLYLPTTEGQVVQIGVGLAIVLPLPAARSHLTWVEGMAEGKPDTFAAVYPEYWRQARADLRWAIAETEARIAEREAALNAALNSGAAA